MKNIAAGNTDDYIAGFPKDIQQTLQEIRATIKKAAPKGEEVISYSMPAYKLNGILVWYAANKSHIGLYPTPGPIKFFKDDLAGYKTSKGAIQFPIDKPMPLDLITKIVQFRIIETQEKMNTKSKKQ
ncbi:MAG: DUF1801 domain-containing protein [Ginsengibacter sp.]